MTGSNVHVIQRLSYALETDNLRKMYTLQLCPTIDRSEPILCCVNIPDPSQLLPS